jgi:hypothetical protein
MACDALFLQRPSTEEDIERIIIAKEYGKKIWVDFDDDLLHVPYGNQYFERFDKAIPLVKLILSLCDVISVSTEQIKTSLIEFTKAPIEVIPNAHNDYAYPVDKRMVVPRKKTIMWRGGSSHAEDLLIHKDVIIEIAKGFPEWSWIFFGYNPWYITQELPKESVATWNAEPIDRYFGILKSVGHAITMVPLKDSLFNRAKSNCAWLEATWAGADTVSSSLPEWQAVGCAAKESFKENLEDALTENETSRKESVEESWNYIKSTLLLSKVNEKRLEIIKSL